MQAAEMPAVFTALSALLDLVPTAPMVQIPSDAQGEIRQVRLVRRLKQSPADPTKMVPDDYYLVQFEDGRQVEAADWRAAQAESDAGLARHQILADKIAGRATP